MLIKTIFAGFGGQGVLMMGYLLAVAGMQEGKNVTYLPSYGAEMRGGTANCTVAISDEEIASPIASEPEYVVVMNKPSLIRFQNQVQSGGMIFINTSLVDMRPIRGDIEVCEVPANELALQLGNERATNMVMLGAFVKRTGLVSLEAVKAAVKEVFLAKNPAFLEINERALMKGFSYLDNNRRGKDAG